MSDNKLNLAENLLAGKNSKVAFKSDVRKSSKIRSPEQIQQEIDEINKYYNKRHNIVKKILIREKKWLDILIWIGVSLLFYIVALIGASMSSNGNFDLFFNFSTTGEAIDFLYMPLYIFVHLFVVSALTFAIKRSVLNLPKVMDIPLAQYEKSVKRFESNLGPLIIALPFILYDSIDIFKDISTGNYLYIGLVPELTLWASWVIEWIIFANIIWLMAYYVIFIYHTAKTYHYDSELLSVVLKNELKPIVHVGYEQSIVLTLFLVLNIIYTIYTGFYATDFLASITLFLLIPLMAVVPIQIVHSDLTKEIKAFSTHALDRILPITKPFFVNENISLENKVDFLLTDRVLYRLQEIHKSHSNKAIYLRILATMAVPAFGYYVDYGPKVVDYINSTFHTNFSFINLIHIILFSIFIH